MKFLVDKEFEEVSTWCTGTFSEFKSNLGEITEQGSDLDGKLPLRLNYNIVQRKNDIINKKITCKIFGAFKNKEESWVHSVTKPTDFLSITVIFPDNRKWKGYKGRYKGKNKKIKPHKIQPQPSKMDEKDCLVWEIDKPKLNHKYELEWTW